MSVQIRTAGPVDIERLAVLAAELHDFTARGVPDRLRIPHEYDLPGIRGLIESTIADLDADFLVAVEGDDVVGFAELHAEADADDPVIQPGRFVRLQSLMVTAGHRRRGIGRSLVDASRRWAAERATPELRLHCWEFDEGPEPFYRALGFRTVKREMARTTGD